jgi:dTDP-4-amino-4,6-dideoxygalactose transaminase
MAQTIDPRRTPVIPVAQPVIGDEEVEAVTTVLRSGQLVQGDVVRRFEGRFADLVGARHAVAVSSGTAALHLAILAHGIGPGDEVITSPFTFVATANAVLYAGARPVFVDIREDTYNLDPALIEEKITERTKAILPVHLYGQPAEMDEILKIAQRHNLIVIEDAAQALDASIDARQVGTFGTGCFSLYATKNMTTGEGGVITTDSEELADSLRMLRHHGQRERYVHEILGFNCRLTDLQAAIGLAQLDRLDELTHRRTIYAAYLSSQLHGLDGVTLPRTLPRYRHVFHQFTIRIPRVRNVVARRLEEMGVGTGVHYPVPVHQQPLYRDLGYRDVLPCAEQASREVLSLPIHPSLTRGDLDIVAERLRGLLARLAPGPLRARPLPNRLPTP